VTDDPRLDEIGGAAVAKIERFFADSETGHTADPTA
jgi:hypothetical protein